MERKMNSFQERRDVGNKSRDWLPLQPSRKTVWPGPRAPPKPRAALEAKQWRCHPTPSALPRPVSGNGEGMGACP